MKKIIVFYSLEGNVKFVAEALAEKIGAELLELHPQKEYPKGGAMKFVVGGFAATVSAKPKLQEYGFCADNYEMIIFGSPVWNSRVTPPLNTFIEKENLKEKKLVAFACHSGGGAEKLFKALSEKVGELLLTENFVNPLKNKEDAEAKIASFAEKISELKN